MNSDETTATPVKWATLAAKFNLPADMKTTGIENIGISDSDAPVEYFNLQGMRVDKPSRGIYIRRQGSSTSKVIL